MKDKKAIFLGGILFLSCINFLYIVWFYKDHKYLPPPFIYDKENTFMDFYNTLYWSGQEGIYSVWNSVYPPLSFLFLQLYQLLFLGDISEFGDGFVIRQVMGGQIFPLLVIYTLSLFVAVGISLRQIADLKTQVIVFLVCLLSPAFLFAIERGNLIILCVPVLSWFIFSKDQISRALSLAILLNLKPYFAVIYIVQLINVKGREENKDFLFLAPVFALILFLTTGLMLNQEFYLMPMNLLGFATNSALLSPTDVLSFPSSITAFAYFRGLVTEFSIPPIFGHLTKLVVYFYLIKSLFLVYKYKISLDDLAILSVIFISNYSVSTGGYGILYYIPALALLYKQRDFILWGVVVVSMYAGVWDLIPIYHYSGGDMSVYLSGETVKIEPYISFGTILRPIANFTVLILFYKNLQKRYLNESI